MLIILSELWPLFEKADKKLVNTQRWACPILDNSQFEAKWGETQWSDHPRSKLLLSLYSFLPFLFFWIFAETITGAKENAVAQMSFWRFFQ